MRACPAERDFHYVFGLRWLEGIDAQEGKSCMGLYGVNIGGELYPVWSLGNMETMEVVRSSIMMVCYYVCSMGMEDESAGKTTDMAWSCISYMRCYSYTPSVDLGRHSGGLFP